MAFDNLTGILKTVIKALDTRLSNVESGVPPADINAISQQVATNLTNNNTFEQPSKKGQASGYAGLDANGKVPSTQMPSSDAVSEGATNKYFTEGRVLATILNGLSIGTNAAIAATDSVLAALGKLQTQINGRVATAPATTTDATPATTVIPFQSFAGTHLDAVNAGFPSMGLGDAVVVHWNLFTSGSVSRAVQMATQVFDAGGGNRNRTFMRVKQDSTLTPWVETGVPSQGGISRLARSAILGDSDVAAAAAVTVNAASGYSKNVNFQTAGVTRAALSLSAGGNFRFDTVSSGGTSTQILGVDNESGVINALATLGASLVPSTDNVITVGTSTARFASFWGYSLNLTGNVTLGAGAGEREINFVATSFNAGFYGNNNGVLGAIDRTNSRFIWEYRGPLNTLTVSAALVLKPAASVTPVNNGEMVVQLTSNTQLTFNVRGSDGVVRSANLTLA